MNINDLQPRVFYRGTIHKVWRMQFGGDDGAYRVSIHHSSAAPYYTNLWSNDDSDPFILDRPVGMITDRNGKVITLYENDIIEVENEEKPGEKSRHVVEWGGNWNPLRSFKRLTFALVPQFYDEKELSIDLSMVLFSGIMRIEIIGNVHENHELANEVWPEGWEKYRNANSQ